ncbi:MAG: fibronectin type III domain-containing protein [Streptomycetaceae bacterium]|nr:MAG: fibronectin type III domain-containing protein [Streptomycetaceae bacterium]
MKHKSLVIRILAVALLSTMLGGFYPAYADNLPADTKYAASIDSLYNQIFVPANASYAKIIILKDSSKKRNTPAYKGWLKKATASMDKLAKSIPAISALTAGPSYLTSDLLLKKVMADYLAQIQTDKKNLQKPVAIKADSAQSAKVSKTIDNEFTTWLAQYSLDSGVANATGPTTSPTIEFSQFVDATTNSNVLVATVKSDSTFNPVALAITSYVIEWYEGVTTATALTNSGPADGVTHGASFQLTGVQVGITYYFRIAGINANGQGPWSAFLPVVL